MQRPSAHLARLTLCTCVLALMVTLARVRIEIAPASDAQPQDLVIATAVRDALSAEQRAAQLVMTSVPGRVLTPRNAQSLRRGEFGGVIVFGENARRTSELRRLLRTVQAAVTNGDAPRALVSVDQEGGAVKRIATTPPWRSAPQLGVQDRVERTRAQGRETARSLRGLGIQLDLAPVADLDIGPKHVMRGRSFGSRPALVARHVSAFIDGLHAGGGAATAKHFPGLGGATVNSDDATAHVHRTSVQLRADLAPFRAAIASGVDVVMLAHARYTALDARRAASASPTVYHLLRDDLQFDGVALTDSLHAVGSGVTRDAIGAGCVRDIAAGADIVLLTGSLEEALRCRAALVRAQRQGVLSTARVDEAVMRVLRLKARLGLLSPPRTTEQPVG